LILRTATTWPPLLAWWTALASRSNVGEGQSRPSSSTTSNSRRRISRSLASKRVVVEPAEEVHATVPFFVRLRGGGQEHLMVEERLHDATWIRPPGITMKRSLFLQIVIRAAVACAILSAATLLVRDAWMAVGLAAVLSFALAANIVRLCRRDDDAIEGAIASLGEGRDVELKPALSEHDRLTVTIRAAVDELQRSFAVSAERREKLEALLDSMQDAVTSIDSGGRIIWANKAMQRLVVDSFGSVRAGHSLVQTIRAPEVLDCVHVALETREYCERKPVSLAPGRVFAVSASPMPEGGAVVVLRDVTRIQQVE